MKKGWKEIVFVLPSIVAAAIAVIGLSLNVPSYPDIKFPDQVEAGQKQSDDETEEGETSQQTEQEKKSKKSLPEDRNFVETSYAGDGIWRDGTYTGSGTGFGGTISVSVTIAEGRLTDIQVTSHAGETPEYYAKASAMIPRILAAQSPNVDTVSGATYSSNGIRQAVIQALNKAEGKEADASGQRKKKTSSPSKGKKNPGKLPKGSPADGTYTGSAVCERFGYTLCLKAKFRSGKVVSLSGLRIKNNEDPANESYWKKAWRPMVKRILSEQSGKVDAVSGATYSSNAIVQAYLDAYAKAVKAGGGNPSSGEEAESDAEPAAAASSTPVPLAGETALPEVTGTIQDGTYTVSASCEPDEDEGFTAYILTADVSFAGGKLTGMDNFRSTDESNKSYYTKAAQGNTRYAGVVQQLLEKQSADGINAVSGATCSSKTIRSLYLQALAQAAGESQGTGGNPSSGEAAESSVTPAPSALTPTPAGEPELTPAPDRKPEPSAGMTAEPEPTGSEPPTGTAVPESPQPPEGESSSGLLSGTYRVSTVVVADEWEEFMDYSLSADVTFTQGHLTAIDHFELGDASNQGYVNLAANGNAKYPGVVNQLLEKEDSSRIDVVSGATCSSEALLRLYESALEMARAQTGA